MFNDIKTIIVKTQLNTQIELMRFPYYQNNVFFSFTLNTRSTSQNKLRKKK